MSDTKTAYNSVMPSATPSDEDILAWEALSRDEQLRRMKTIFAQLDRNVAGNATMADILAEARVEADAQRHG